MISQSIIGNLTRDPETRTVNGANGPTTVTNFTIATNSKRNREKKFFVRATAWGNVGTTIAKYAKCGSKMFLKGEPSLSCYTSNNGESRATMELTVEEFEFLSSHLVAETSPAMVAVAAPASYSSYDLPAEDNEEPFEDDGLPF